jgi:hypothetical protein
MPGKRSSPPTSVKRARNGRRNAAYPSLSQGPTPAERRKAVENRMRQRGLEPVRAFDSYLSEVGDFWPKDETCDEFLVWLSELRQEG